MYFIIFLCCASEKQTTKSPALNPLSRVYVKVRVRYYTACGVNSIVLHKRISCLSTRSMWVRLVSVLQIAQIDLLTRLGLQPDGIVGHSVGELACGYADGSLSHTEAILAAYWRGRCIKEANLPPGGMAAVGKGFSESCFWLFIESHMADLSPFGAVLQD